MLQNSMNNIQFAKKQGLFLLTVREPFDSSERLTQRWSDIIAI